MTITDTGTRIELPFTDMADRRDTVRKECYLHLYDRYMEYKVVALYEFKNEDTDIWDNIKANERWVRLRSDLADIGMYYNNPSSKWMVTIEFRGISGNNGWAFDDPKEALRIHNQLQDYFLGRV